MNSLQTLDIQVSHEDFVRVLQAVTCKALKTMAIHRDFGDMEDAIIDEICTFPTLVSLQLDSFKVTDGQFETLAHRFPHLAEFGMGMTENVQHTVQLTLRWLPKLRKLSIAPGPGDYYPLADVSKRSMQEFGWVQLSG